MFCEKSHSCNSQPAHIKKIKLKIFFDKNHNKKTIWENTVEIHSI